MCSLFKCCDISGWSSLHARIKGPLSLALSPQAFLYRATSGIWLMISVHVHNNPKSSLPCLTIEKCHLDFTFQLRLLVSVLKEIARTDEYKRLLLIKNLVSIQHKISARKREVLQALGDTLGHVVCGTLRNWTGCIHQFKDPTGWRTR